MRDTGYKPYGSFADLTKKPINRVRGNCQKCGCGLSSKRKPRKFCAACSVEEQDAAKARYKQRKRDEKSQSA